MIQGVASEFAFLVWPHHHSSRQAIKTQKEFRKFCRVKKKSVDTYIFVYLISDFGSKYRGGDKANTQAKISKATKADVEAVFLGEDILTMKGINSGTEKEWKTKHTGKGGEQEVVYTCSHE